MTPSPQDLDTLLADLGTPEVQSDPSLRIKVSTSALQLISRDSDTDLWARLTAELGAAHLALRVPDRSPHIEIAIRSLEAAVQIVPRDVDPSVWAANNVNLGAAYQMRIAGNPSENVDRSIEAFTAALTVFTRENAPLPWATAQINLGNSLWRRGDGRSPRDLEKAIYAVEYALTVLTIDNAPDDWARAKTNLGTLYVSRQQGALSANIETAVRCFEDALLVRTRELSPFEWAITSMKLGSALLQRAYGIPVENLDRAVRGLRGALEVLNAEQTPVEWAIAATAMASALLDPNRHPAADAANAADIAEAIRLSESACAIVSKTGPLIERIRAQGAFAHLLIESPAAVPSAAVERAIDLLREILPLTDRAHAPAEWLRARIDYGNAHILRIPGTREDNLQAAIAAYREVIAGDTEQRAPSLWALAQRNLASALTISTTGGREANIAQALTHFEAALRVHSRERSPREWATTVGNLGGAYLVGVSADRAADLARAIECCEQALEVYDPAASPRDAAPYAVNLARALLERSQEDSDPRWINRALALIRPAASAYDPQFSPREHVQALSTLANVLFHSVQGDPAANLDQSIAAARRALAIATPSALPSEYPEIASTLVDALRRCLSGDHAAALEEAISLGEHALASFECDLRPDLCAALCANLSIVWSERLLDDPKENLRTAIRYAERARRLQGQARRRLPGTAADLIRLSQLYSSLETPEGTQQAVDAARQAMAIATSEASPRRHVRAQLQLAVVLVANGKGDPQDLRDAIGHFESALSLLSPSSDPEAYRIAARNLATTFIAAGGPDALDRARHWYRASLDVTPESLHRERMLAHIGLGHVSFQRGEWREAADHFLAAIRIRQSAFTRAVSLESRGELLHESRDVLGPLAWSLSQCGGEDDLRQAVAAVENARTRFISDLLALDEAAAGSLRPADRDAFLAARDTLRAAQVRAAAALAVSHDEFVYLTREIEQAAGRLDRVLATIHEDEPAFLAPISFAEIQRAASAAPLVYLLASDASGLALIVPAAGAVRAVPLPSLASGEVGSKLALYALSYVSREPAPTVWHDALARTLAWLWDGLFVPLLDALAPEPEAVLIAAGVLGILPLQAAGSPATGYVTDRIRLRFSPTARILLRPRSDAPAASILAVDEPRPVDAPPLSYSSEEVDAALSLFAGRLVIRHEDAGFDRVLAAVAAGHDVLHFSCHGFADLRQPLDSGIVLGGGRFLRVRDLLAVRTAARLVVLSSCESALSGGNLDESLSLGASLLSAGAGAVICASWSVYSISTMLLMIRFYRFWRSDGFPAAEALRRAQIWLRDTANEQKLTWLRESDPAAASRFETFRLLAGVPEDYFAHPAHWAGFNYVGL